MKITTFHTDHDATLRIGVVDDGYIYDATSVLETHDLKAVLAKDGLRRLDNGQWSELPKYRLEDITWDAPLRPGKIVGVGLNYSEHVDESAKSLDTDAAAPTRPVLFSKPATAVVGHHQPILHNGDLTNQLDWEVELAVVIGRTARNVKREDALSYVFGYSVINDISARDQRRSGQWFYSKGQDSYAPFGPYIVTADDVPEPQALHLSLTVNGEKMQDGLTSQMLFTIAELIEDISRGMTLEPGDVLATGSPKGVGAAQTPPRFLQPGDVVEATIDGVGSLCNVVVDAR